MELRYTQCDMRIHALEHEPFEESDNIAKWARFHRHSLSRSRLFLNEPLPAHNSFDFLVIMGGGMGTKDTDLFPWLISEKKFIKESIDRHKLVLGICLGAQLVAEALGGIVSKNTYREIGWFRVNQTQDAQRSAFWQILPETFPAFHWHGDTFSIPSRSCHALYSEACTNQAFDYDNGRVVGLQFHLEVSEPSIERFLFSCAHELTEDTYVQSRHDILHGRQHISDLYFLLTRLLDKMASN